MSKQWPIGPQELLEGLDEVLTYSWRRAHIGDMGDLEAFYWSGVQAAAFIFKCMFKSGFTQYSPSIENILLTAYEHALEDYTNGLLKERGDGE